MLRCPTCPYFTIYKQNMQKHIARKHGVVEPESVTEPKPPPLTQCPHCTFTSTRSYNVKRHMERVHEKVQNSSENSQEPLKNQPSPSQNSHSHLKKQPSTSENSQHQDGFIICTLCKQVYTRSDNYKRHVSRCRGVAPLQCKFCKKEHETLNARQKHEKRCTVLPEYMNESSEPVSEDVRYT